MSFIARNETHEISVENDIASSSRTCSNEHFTKLEARSIWIEGISQSSSVRLVFSRGRS